MKLENWSLVYGEIGPYDAPESGGARISGEVYGNPSFDEGQIVMTSRVMKVYADGVITRNSTYELGDPHPLYEQKYPGARNRLLNS